MYYICNVLIYLKCIIYDYSCNYNIAYYNKIIYLYHIIIRYYGKDDIVIL